jgi:hypothetical protein
MRHFGHLWSDGALEDQPAWFMLELLAISEGVQKYEQMAAKQQALKDETEARMKAALGMPK